MNELEFKTLRDMAEKCAGVAPGEKKGQWTHEDRVALVYSVLCALTRLNKKQKVKNRFASNKQ